MCDISSRLVTMAVNELNNLQVADGRKLAVTVEEHRKQKLHLDRQKYAVNTPLYVLAKSSN